MIAQRLVRPQLGLRAVSSSNTLLRSQTQTRFLHRVPLLINEGHLKEHGIPDVLSADGFDMAWTQYQGRMVEKLNAFTAGTPDENQTPGQLLVKYARDASMASLFNHASMAHNNHFFFNCMTNNPVPIPQKLETLITESCSSVDSLKAEFLATANAMFGPGFVWLVKLKDSGQLKILSTYIAGSPYPAAHYRRQPVDMATQTTGVAGGENLAAVGQIAQKKFGSMGQHAQSKVLAPGGADVHPILCVNTWEHVWLRDWGIHGKPEYLEAWWNAINWDEVANNAAQFGPSEAAPGPRSGGTFSTRVFRYDK